MRNDIPAVDVFCQSSAFTAKWSPSSNELTGTDYIAGWLPDRFNNHVPEFDSPEDMAVSPDGQHVYLSTPDQGILIFGRGAPVVDEESGNPDLVIHSPHVNNSSPAAGGAITLSAIVRNQGHGRSATTMLRYYRSTNTIITVADSEVGSIPVGSLESLGSSGRSINLTAPLDPGTYHYGACVDTVADESDTTNNCSTAVTVTVSDASEPVSPDLVVESPSVSNDSPETGESFTLNVVVRNQGDGQSTATNLHYYRSDDTTISGEDTEVGTDAIPVLSATATSNESINLTAPSTAGTYHYGACVDTLADESDTTNNCSAAATVTVVSGLAEDFDLDADNRNPVGIAYAVSGFHVVDDSDDKVYAYGMSGERDAASDFDLDADNRNPEAIVYANERFYVFDDSDDKAYAYRMSGERDSTADFDLDADNGFPAGVAYANDRFYVVDLTDDKVYVYQTSGQYDSISDFELAGENSFPYGIAYANDRFYVVDRIDRKSYGYNKQGEREPDFDFDLDANNSRPNGITIVNGRIYVVDNLDDKIYAYQ